MTDGWRPCAWAFAAGTRANWNPWLCVASALLVGVISGLVKGLLVMPVRLSSLVATCKDPLLFVPAVKNPKASEKNACEHFTRL